MTHVLAGANVAQSEKTLHLVPPGKGLELVWPGRVEAFSQHAEPNGVYWICHGLVEAIHVAYGGHFALALSPDMLWLPIVQGLATIVDEAPETYRTLFVSHEGQIELRVSRDGFVLGSPANDWPGVYTEFSEQVRDHVGVANHERLVATFSTTGLHERAANEIALMDVVQHYFRFTMTTVCGIPKVYLEGTAGDWRELRTRTASIGEAYGCTWWTDHMLPWLDRIAAAADGNEDRELWETIYKTMDMSGGPYVGGWITQFFPYVDGGRSRSENALLGKVGADTFLTTAMLPTGLSRVPFRWQYLDRQLDMEFHAGFLGASQLPDSRAIRPRIGWAVVHASSGGG